MTDTPDVQKIAAEWLHDYAAKVANMEGLVLPWDADAYQAEWWLKRAAEFLSAVEPVIRREVAEEIADRIAPLIDSAIGDDTHNAYVNAAAIARSVQVDEGSRA